MCVGLCMYVCLCLSIWPLPKAKALTKMAFSAQFTKNYKSKGKDLRTMLSQFGFTSCSYSGLRWQITVKHQYLSKHPKDLLKQAVLIPARHTPTFGCAPFTSYPDMQGSLWRPEKPRDAKWKA